MCQQWNILSTLVERRKANRDDAQPVIQVFTKLPGADALGEVADHQAEQERIEYLEKKIRRKDEVLAELMGEHIALKKELGEL